MDNRTIMFSHEGSAEFDVSSEYALMDINLEDTAEEVVAQFIEGIKEVLGAFWGYPVNADILVAGTIKEPPEPKIIVPTGKILPSL